MVANIVKKRIRKAVFLSLAFLVPKVLILILLIGAALGAVDTAQRAAVSVLVRGGGSGDTILFLSYEVLRWREVVEYWTNHYEIPDWTIEVLAIMHVETGGRHADLMQSSESAGLPPNTLRYEESIAQGVRYLARIIARAKSFGIEDDRLGIFQAYNFGIFYINHLARNGSAHSLEIAATYSRTVVAPSLGNATGRRLSYQNPIAIAHGKPWIYANGGNFHYAFIVQDVIERLQASVVDDAYFVGNIALPLDPPFRVTSRFGPRSLGFHHGIDLTVRFGAPVRAVMPGTVVYIVDRWGSDDGHLNHPGGWGNLVRIYHGGGVQTLYTHLMREILVEVGDTVVAGQRIGYQGNSGRSSGTHLHFEWWEHGARINPETRINFRTNAE